MNRYKNTTGEAYEEGFAAGNTPRVVFDCPYDKDAPLEAKKADAWENGRSAGFMWLMGTGKINA